MVASSRNGLPSWLGMATATRNVEIDNKPTPKGKESSNPSTISNHNLSLGERAFSAAGAALISAIVVNPLDVAKTRLQAQAAGVPYNGLCESSCSETTTIPQGRNRIGTQPTCSPDCARYKGTLDVLYRVTRQEGFFRLWRGVNASIVLAVPSVGIYMPLYDVFRIKMEEITSQNVPSLTPYVPMVAGSMARTMACITCYPVELARTRMQAFQHSQADVSPPGVRKTLVGVLSPVKTANNHQAFQSYRVLWTGVGAQLSRDVPFSAICWLSLEPLRRAILSRIGDEGNAFSILVSNFSAGFFAGGVAAAATCPLDVARTRRQIEKDPARASRMTTRQTLLEIWRDGGMKGLFAGVGPRVARTGPSVGIVVSFYEVVKYVIQHYKQSD